MGLCKRNAEAARKTDLWVSLGIHHILVLTTLSVDSDEVVLDMLSSPWWVLS